jgi:hypothetical protein
VPKDTDWAYAAGLVDGDGSINISKERRYDRPNPFYFRVNVRVAQTDMAALIWLKEIFGGCIYFQNRQRGNRKTCWCWSIRSRKLIVTFLESILPYLKIKQQQAQLCLKFYEHVRNHRPKKKITLAEREAQEVLANRISVLNVCHKVPQGG